MAKPAARYKPKQPKSLALSLLPKPGRGFFWLDLLYTLLVLGLQVSLLPTLFPFTRFDLLTPWLAYYFIVLGTSQSMLIAMVGALALEQHGASPTGLYVCAYWIMGTLIAFVRRHISWRSIMPWMVTMVLSQLWVILFETLVYVVKTSSLGFFNFAYVGGLLARLLLAFVFGVYFAARMPELAGEEKAA